jgi:hypothetical protein
MLKITRFHCGRKERAVQAPANTLFKTANGTPLNPVAGAWWDDINQSCATNK